MSKGMVSLVMFTAVHSDRDHDSLASFSRQTNAARRSHLRLALGGSEPEACGLAS
jgi:hypothetical protein